MRRPALSAVHSEIERMIEYARQLAGAGRDDWYAKQGDRWAANRPCEGATAEGVGAVGAKRSAAPELRTNQ